MARHPLLKSGVTGIDTDLLGVRSESIVRHMSGEREMLEFPRGSTSTPYGAEGAAIARRGSVPTTTSSTPPSAQWASTVT